MSKRTDQHIYELIRSLTTQEKIELKKHGLFSEKDSPYTLVYDALEKMKEYNEDELLKKTNIKSERLPEIKNHLFKQILKVLAYVHSNHITEIREFQHISQILVLGYKGFFDLALKKLNEAIEEFTRSENYLNVLLLVQLKDEIHFRFKPQGNMVEYAAKAFDAYAYWLNELYELSYYKYGFFSATLPMSRFQSKTSSGHYSKQVKGIRGLGLPSKPNTILKQIFLISMQSRNALSTKDFQLARDLSNTGLNYIHQKSRKGDDIPNYLTFGLYFVKLTSCMYIDSYEEGMATMAIVEKKLKEDNQPYANAINKAYYGINKLSYLNMLGKHEEALQEAAQFTEQHKVLLKEFLSLANIWSYNMAYAHFFMGNYKLSLKYIYQFTQVSKEKIARMDFMQFAMLLEILILIEQKELVLAEGKLRAYQRTMRTSGTYSGFAKKVFQFAKRSLTADLTPEYYLQQLEVLFKDHDPLESNYFKRFFDIRTWLALKGKRATNS